MPNRPDALKQKKEDNLKMDQQQRRMYEERIRREGPDPDETDEPVLPAR